MSEVHLMLYKVVKSVHTKLMEDTFVIIDYHLVAGNHDSYHKSVVVALCTLIQID